MVVAKRLMEIAKGLVSERVPVCANCGARIDVWAKQQGVLPATTISMMLCQKERCNLEAVKDAKRYLKG